uniref:MADS-box transcription factor 1 n=1 Tax=Aegilops tauschii TaxID=37682 RepID=M8BE22_AEGTA
MEASFGRLLGLCTGGRPWFFGWGSGGSRVWWCQGLGCQGGGPGDGSAVLMGRATARLPRPCGRRGSRGVAFGGGLGCQGGGPGDGSAVLMGRASGLVLPGCHDRVGGVVAGVWRSVANQVLLDQLFELKSKEQELQDENNDLRKKGYSCKIPPVAAETMRSICPGKTEGSVAPEYYTRSMIPPCKLGMFFYMSISEKLVNLTRKIKKLVSSGLHGPAEQTEITWLLSALVEDRLQVGYD